MKRFCYIWILLVSVSAHAQLTLDSCLSLARQNSVEIQRAQLNKERAHEVRMQAMTKFFPQVQATTVGFHALQPLVDVGIEDIGNASVRDLLLTLYGNYGAALGLDNTLSLFQHGMTAGVSAIQPVYMGGKIVAGNKLAQLGEKASMLQSEITERDLMEQVEECYWLVAGLEEKEQTIAGMTKLLDTLYHQVDIAVAAGLVLETDRLEVQAKQSELLRQKQRLESGLRLARRALAQSIGLDVEDVMQLETEPQEIPDQIAQAEGHYAEEELLELQTKAAMLQKRMVLADALPHVAVGANYGYSKLDANILKNGLGGWNGALFVTVSFPLTGWWETAHKLREHSLAIEDARLQEKDLTEKLELKKQQCFDQLKDAIAMLQMTEDALRVATERARLARVGYEAGQMTITNYLAAEMQQLQALNDHQDARHQLMICQRRYLQLVNNNG